MEKFKEYIFPFEYGEKVPERYDAFCLTFINVTFLEDFGVFKKGETVEQLNVNFREGYLYSWSEDEEYEEKEEYFHAISGTIPKK